MINYDKLAFSLLHSMGEDLRSVIMTCWPATPSDPLGTRIIQAPPEDRRLLSTMLHLAHGCALGCAYVLVRREHP